MMDKKGILKKMVSGVKSKFSGVADMGGSFLATRYADPKKNTLLLKHEGDLLDKQRMKMILNRERVNSVKESEGGLMRKRLLKTIPKRNKGVNFERKETLKGLLEKTGRKRESAENTTLNVIPSRRRDVAERTMPVVIPGGHRNLIFND